MKKVLSVLACILLGMLLVLPLGVVLSAIFGYQFALWDPFVFQLIAVAVAAVLVALCLITKEIVENKIVQVVFAITTPCALISAVFFVTACGGKCVIPSLLLCAGCCYLTIRQGQPQMIRAGALVLTASLILPACLCCVVMVAVNNVKSDDVVQTLDSPSGSHYAVVIKSYQEENMGNMIVKVYKKQGFDAGIFKVSKKPQRIYVGDYGRFEELEVSWKNEERLLINSGEYIVK